MKVPWRYIPHFHRPGRPGPHDGYRCLLCGSRSARVQKKGNGQYRARHKVAGK